MSNIAAKKELIYEQKCKCNEEQKNQDCCTLYAGQIK